jgi:hypothetical protein
MIGKLRISEAHFSARGEIFTRDAELAFVMYGWNICRIYVLRRKPTNFFAISDSECPVVRGGDHASNKIQRTPVRTEAS